MKLIFIYGLPGVGKLTVAKALSDQTGLNLFHNHMVLDPIITLFGVSSFSSSKLRESIWINFFRHAASVPLDGIIFTFCFDSALSKNFLSKVEHALGPQGSICFVKLTCSENALRKRLPQKSRKVFGKATSFEKLMEDISDKYFYLPRLRRKVLAIDNSFLSAKKVATIIAKEYNL